MKNSSILFKLLIPIALIAVVTSTLALHPVATSLAIGVTIISVLSLAFTAGNVIGFTSGKKLISARVEKQTQILQEEILKRKEKEEELIEAKQEALRGVQAKDQFLSNMSHEIRTPLNGIIGLINILVNSNLDEKQKEYLSAMDYSAQNLLVLINEILDLSKINSEKLTLESIDFDLHKTINSVENIFQVTAQEKGIFLRTVINPNVPQYACGDPTRVNQILLNLMGNAIKFTHEGGVDLVVNLVKDNGDDMRIQCQVNDTGVGIPADRLDAIFETFTQASSETSRVFGGSGLGLAISKELVNLMGGQIKVESEEGKGSSFSFEISLKSAQESQPSLQENKINDEHMIGESFNILVAEDNLVNQMVVASTLETKGYNVTIVPNGQEVIESIYQKNYDLILMDVQMPLMNGLDATRFIRMATEAPLSNTKIVAMTASVMKEDIDKCMEAGMDDYVPKPFHPDQLFDTVAKHLTFNRAAA